MYKMMHLRIVRLLIGKEGFGAVWRLNGSILLKQGIVFIFMPCMPSNVMLPNSVSSCSVMVRHPEEARSRWMHVSVRTHMYILECQETRSCRRGLQKRLTRESHGEQPNQGQIFQEFFFLL